MARLPLVLLFHLSLLSRVFGSHTTLYCVPDLTTLGHVFLFTPSSFILQFCSQTGRLKLIGKFLYTQSVSWLITTSQVFPRVLFCLQPCWFSRVKLWIKDRDYHADIKYLSVITEQFLFYPKIQFFYLVCITENNQINTLPQKEQFLQKCNNKLIINGTIIFGYFLKKSKIIQKNK